MRWSFILLAVPLAACTCKGWPSPKRAWEDSSVVFAGIVESVEPVRVRVEEPFKRTTVGAVFQWADGHSDCGGGFRTGERYLFYFDPERSPSPLSCGRTRELINAADDLLFLRALPGSAKRTQVSGTLMQSQDLRPAEMQPLLRDSMVRISGAAGTWNAKPNSEGVFEIYDLPPGNYEIGVRVPEAYYAGSPIILGSGGAKEILVRTKSFELVPEGGVSASFVIAPRSFPPRR